MVGIFSYTDMLDEAWQFINWMQTRESADALAEQAYNLGGFHLPPQIGSYEVIRGEELGVHEVFAAQLADVTAPSHCPGWKKPTPKSTWCCRESCLKAATLKKRCSTWLTSWTKAWTNTGASDQEAVESIELGECRTSPIRC